MEIELDTIVPNTPVLNSFPSRTNQASQIITGTKDKNTSVWFDGKEIIPCNEETIWNYSIQLKEGKNVFSLYAKDKVENQSTPMEAEIELDTRAPEGIIKINNDDKYINILKASLTLSSNEAQQVQLSSDGQNWSTPEPYVSQKEWQLEGGEGEKTVYVKFKDEAGNWSESVRDTIILDTTAPSITEVNPGDGAAFYENDTILISPIVSDTDSSPLEYQFSIDGVIKQSWSNLSSYSWAASLQNTGSHNIKIEARDEGGQDNKQVEIYIFRKPLLPTN